jgi:glycosyltransferase involved in cell wall biosynthesis
MISIVIPAYNSQKYIAQTLDSILCQNYQDYEVILVDAYSNDSTLKIASAYQTAFNGRMKIYSREKQGQVDAINHGFSLSKGDILAFINSDDTYEPGCFSAISYYFAKQNGWVYGIGKVINSQGEFTRSFVTWFKSLWWKRASYDILRWFCYISQPTVFLSRDLYREVGDFNKEYDLCFDYDYWLRLWQIKNPVFINKHLANWRVHGDTKSVSNQDKQIDESLKINRKYTENILDIFIQKLVALATRIAYRLI